MNKLGRLCAGALAAAAVAATPAAAQNFHDELPCDGKVPAKLKQLGVAEADIASSLTEEEWYRDSVRDVFQGWFVWMKMKTCDGRLVMRLSPGCTVQTVYTDGACRIDGVDRSG